MYLQRQPPPGIVGESGHLIMTTCGPGSGGRSESVMTTSAVSAEGSASAAGPPGVCRDAAAPQHACWALAPRPQTVGAARGLIRTTLRLWGAAEVFDSCALVASELLGNALRHGIGGVSEGTTGGCSATPPIRLDLRLRRGRLLCSVSDPSPAPPVLKEPDYFAESGRGLHLIDSLSESWGWTLSADRPGKSVWASLSAAAPS